MKLFRIGISALFGLASLMSAQAFFSVLGVVKAQSRDEQNILNGNTPCNAPEILTNQQLDTVRLKNSPTINRKDYNFIACVTYRLVRANRLPLPPGLGESWTIQIVHNDQINSQMLPLQDGRFMVQAYDSMARFINYDSDEEAFIVGHEIGHILDFASCQKARAQAMFKNQAQQTCEEHADLYGLQYMWGAGFNPYAAGAFMGRLQMYLPNDTRGIFSAINNLVSDHPISSARTEKLREDFTMLCSKPDSACTLQ